MTTQPKFQQNDRVRTRSAEHMYGSIRNCHFDTDRGEFSYDVKMDDYAFWLGFHESELELEPAPAAQTTLTQALEAIASESEPRMSSYLSMQDMMLDYVEKVARMKKLADDALQAASQPTGDADAAAGSEG